MCRKQVIARVGVSQDPHGARKCSKTRGEATHAPIAEVEPPIKAIELIGLATHALVEDVELPIKAIELYVCM